MTKTSKDIIEEEVEKMLAEYREAYRGILPNEVLDTGHSWFEKILRSSLTRAMKAACEAVVVEKKSMFSMKQTLTHGDEELAQVQGISLAHGWNASRNRNIANIKRFFGEDNK